MQKKPTPIESAVVLKCSTKTRKLISDYSLTTGISMRRIVDDMALDWISTVGRARLDALKSALNSQNENSA